MVTQSNSKAVVFSLELRCGRIGYLATMKRISENSSSIRFASNFLKILRDTLRYLGMYRMTSYEEKKNALASSERLSKNAFFRKSENDWNTYFKL